MNAGFKKTARILFAAVLLFPAGFFSALSHAQKPLATEPDEGGIGGTGNTMVPTQKPELIDRPDMPERIEHVERVEPVEHVDPPGGDFDGSTGVDGGEITVTPPVDQQH